MSDDDDLEIVSDNPQQSSVWAVLLDDDDVLAFVRGLPGGVFSGYKPAKYPALAMKFAYEVSGTDTISLAIAEAPEHVLEQYRVAFAAMSAATASPPAVSSGPKATAGLEARLSAVEEALSAFKDMKNLPGFLYRTQLHMRTLRSIILRWNCSQEDYDAELLRQKELLAKELQNPLAPEGI